LTLDAAQQRVDMLVEGDRLGGADRQCMAEAEQQPARFVNRRHSATATCPSFVS
jgi:hypothetical protein